MFYLQYLCVLFIYVSVVYVAAEQSNGEDGGTGEPPEPEDQPGDAAQRAQHCKGPTHQTP